MNSEANLRMYTEGREWVTFAVFTYNQEKYIQKAIESALSQTYEPLQIIISDDCSTDRTFEIVQKMVGFYEGPHKIVINRNPKNMGLISHVNYIFNLVDTEIIVVAAGDDISMPSRTSEVVNAFVSNKKILAMHSNAIEMDDSGRMLRELVPPVVSNRMSIEDITISNSLHIGATAAYKKELHRRFGPITEMNTYEDLIYGFRASMLHGLGYIDKPLVCYRVNVGISSQFSKKNSANKIYKRIIAIKHEMATLRQRKKDCKRVPCPETESLLLAIKKEMKYQKYKLLLYKRRAFLIRLFVGDEKTMVLRAVLSEIIYRYPFFEKSIRRASRMISMLR